MPQDKEQEEQDKTEVEETEDEKDPEEETSDPQDTEDEEDDLSPEELRAQQKELKARLKKVNAEAKERRLALEKLQKEKKDREEEELSEKEKAEKRAKEAEDNLAALRQENRSLKLAGLLVKKVKELKLEFVSTQAQEDALKFLDPEKLGEDFDGLEDEIKALAKNRAYLFGKPDPNQFNNDGSAKGKRNARIQTRQVLENKKRLVSGL